MVTKNKLLVAGLIIGAIVIFALTAILLILPANRFSSSSSGADVTVEMTADGFSRQEITIKRGQTIEWINRDQDFRWPASNVHPSHEKYPDFDPKEPIAPGQSWSFTFDQVGEWQFHDHLKPYFVGTVSVVE
jgi:plastocyanin